MIPSLKEFLTGKHRPSHCNADPRRQQPAAHVNSKQVTIW